MKFCPKCGGLLVPRRDGDRIRYYCTSCQMYEDEITVEKKTLGGGNSEFPLFPYPEIREGQIDFMRDIKKALTEDAILVAEAPTGIGKTVSALSVALEIAMERKKKVFFLTSKQSQHHIAVETLRDIRDATGVNIKAVDIISKQDMCPLVDRALSPYAFIEFCKTRIKAHKCTYFEGRTDRTKAKILSDILHVNELRDMAVMDGVCPHKVALEAAAEADVIICDYNYIFSDMREMILDRLGIGMDDIIVIVDEAHNLPERIRSQMRSSLSRYRLEETISEVSKLDPRLNRILSELLKRMDARAMEVTSNETYMSREEFISMVESIGSESLSAPMSFTEIMDRLMDVGDEILDSGVENSYAIDMAEFMSLWLSREDIFARIFYTEGDGRWTLTINSLDPSRYSEGVFAEISSGVLMSGTLYPQEMYVDILGIPRSRAITATYPSPFPARNRKVLCARDVSTAYKKRSKEMYRNIARWLGTLPLAVEGHAAAFFPSYQILEDVSYEVEAMFPELKVLVEERGMLKEEREEFIKKLYSEEKRRILLMGVLGGSLSEGVDYRGNILRGIAIVGLPLAPPNLEVQAMREYLAKKFGREKGEIYGYLAPAINKVIQGIGRLIRSETDRGIILLLDERYIYAKYRSLLSPSLRPTIIKDPEMLKMVAKRFFSRQEKLF